MIDLHLHSTCSDGSEAPARVVELAATAGCDAVALTDHDGLGGVEQARPRRGLGLGFVPGCEVSCVFSPGTMHILCYFIESGEGPLQDELKGLRQDSSTRNERLVRAEGARAAHQLRRGPGGCRRVGCRQAPFRLSTCGQRRRREYSGRI